MSITIGSTVYKGQYDRKETSVLCPDCFGDKRLTVILGDKSEVSIECEGCASGGYEPARGRIKQYDFDVIVRKFIVTGIRMRIDEVEYELDGTEGGCWVGTDKNTFDNEKSASAYAESQKLEHQDEENRRLLAKTKDHKSWSWNATYYRGRIRGLEKELEHYRNKLQACPKDKKDRNEYLQNV